VTHLSVGVGDSMCKPDLIIEMLKLVVKRQCVVVVDTFAHAVVLLQKRVIVKIVVLSLFTSRNLILKVLYVLTVALPAIKLT